MIEMPPLRAIPEDIPARAGKFLREACHEIGRPLLEISTDALSMLKAHSWLGNVRELRNVVKHAAIMADDLISPAILQGILGEIDPAARISADQDQSSEVSPDELPLKMAEVEKWALKRALAAAGGKKMVAARLLDMNYYTFRRRMVRYKMDDEVEE